MTTYPRVNDDIELGHLMFRYIVGLTSIVSCPCSCVCGHHFPLEPSCAIGLVASLSGHAMTLPMAFTTDKSTGTGQLALKVQTVAYAKFKV